MADLDLQAAPAGVAGNGGAPKTGEPQGGEPKLSPLYDQLPEASRKALKAERFVPLAKLDNLVAEITRLDGEVGNGIRVPGKDATKEQVAKYRKELGIPESPEGYSLQKPQLPNGLPYNDRLEKWFRQELFDAGVPDAAAQKMFNDWNTAQIATFQANQKLALENAQKFAKDAEDTLKAEWKDDYPKNINIMKSALAAFGGADVLSVLQQARLPNGMTLDNHPAFAKMLYEVGRRTQEDTMVGADGFTRKSPVGREFVNPVTGKKIPGMFPGMEADPRFRVKTE